MKGAKIYEVGPNGKKHCVTSPPEPLVPFSIYDAKNNINAKGDIRYIKTPEGSEESPPSTEAKIIEENKKDTNLTPTPPIITEFELPKKEPEPPISFKNIQKSKENNEPTPLSVKNNFADISPINTNFAGIQTTTEIYKVKINEPVITQEDQKSIDTSPENYSFKPIPRVHTAANLSESVEIIEGSNGPILQHEEESPVSVKTEYDAKNLFISTENLDYNPMKPPTNLLEIRMPENNNCINLHDFKEEFKNENSPKKEASKIDYSKLPIDKWPKPKSKTKVNPIPELNSLNTINNEFTEPRTTRNNPRDNFPNLLPIKPAAAQNSKQLPIIKQRPKVSQSNNLKPPEHERKPSIEKPEHKPNETNGDELLLTPKEKPKITAETFNLKFPPVKIISKDAPLFKFVYGWSMRSKDDDEGEDACFACERGLGVADGVSGWSTYGIKASAFSQKLMEESENEIRLITGLKKEEVQEKQRSRVPRTASYVALDFQANTIYDSKVSDEDSIGPDTACSPKNMRKSFETPINTLQVLSNAYEKVTDIGSSTATIVAINGNEIEAVNLGDSGFIHLKLQSGEYVLNGVSKEQQHEFNVPYQLSRLPSPDYLSIMESEGKIKEVKQLRRVLDTNKMCKDNPESADQYNQEVQENDIIVLGTDGVFDNIFSYEIKNIIRDCMRSITKPTQRNMKVFFSNSNQKGYGGKNSGCGA